MDKPAQHNEIAREAIKRLAARRQPPTPENFRRAYLEVSGGSLPKPVWPEAIRALLAQWENYQAGLTQARKREMLDRVLINFATDSDQLSQKIFGLAESWSKSAAGEVVLDDDGGEEAAATPGEVSAPVRTGMPQPFAAVGQVLCDSLAELAGGCRPHWPDLAAQAEDLRSDLAADEHVLSPDRVLRLAGLWRAILVRGENDREAVEGLRRLLALLFGNIGELVAEDAWLAGQMIAMQGALTGELNIHSLFQAEENLQEVVRRQKSLKGSLNDAKEKLRRLISTFIDRVGELSSSTGGYQERIQTYSARVAQADDIAQLSDVIDALSTDMQQMHSEIRRSHDDLLEARRHVEEAEERIHSLERELQEVSTLVREDQLTGALNRRGLDEAFGRELSRAQRLSAPFAVALLDIDHFKRLNDALGHQAGDQALVHLARVVRQLLRPTDSLGRYGGEEFLILLPNSDLDEAEKVMLRLQRELTRQFFLHRNERVLMTFSAGVAQLATGEGQDELIGRADQAMYRAKAAGRNRVERG